MSYGLAAMTGILPTIVVAGTATGMATQMFPRQKGTKSKSKGLYSSVFGPPPKARNGRRTKKGNVFDVIF